VSNDYHKIVGDDDVRVAIIATPHAFHAEQALDFLAMGKAVLVEKPAAVTFQQLAALKNFFSHNKESLFCADFNRSCSPFMKEIKNVLINRTNPILVTYRMNANYLPKGHWIQNEENRGRIIGEACHIFELFCFLTDSRAVSVMVNTLNPTTDDLVNTDNIIVTITMSDGSCCSLLYSSLGNHGVGKEYMELFFDGKTITMNDYFELKGYGLPKSFDRHARTQDKGHQALCEQFFKAAKSKNEPSPVPLERILMATEISLIVDKLARAGGGFEYIDYE
jgi:predicted dehydrogenase